MSGDKHEVNQGKETRKDQSRSIDSITCKTQKTRIYVLPESAAEIGIQDDEWLSKLQRPTWGKGGEER